MHTEMHTGNTHTHTHTHARARTGVVQKVLSLNQNEDHCGTYLLWQRITTSYIT